jgi:hypothetical protein
LNGRIDPIVSVLMVMRARSIAGGIVLLALAPAAAHAQGGAPAELRLEWASPGFAQSRSTPALAAGGLIGGAVGALGGFYVGAILGSDDDDDDLDFLGTGVAVGTIGEGLLLPLGVHIANGSRGSYRTSGLVSLGLAAGGLLALEAAHYDPPAAPIILIAVPIAQLAASIAIERATD